MKRFYDMIPTWGAYESTFYHKRTYKVPRIPQKTMEEIGQSFNKQCADRGLEPHDLDYMEIEQWHKDLCKKVGAPVDIKLHVKRRKTQSELMDFQYTYRVDMYVSVKDGND